MDSPASHRISVPGGTQEPGGSPFAFAYGTVTLYGWLSHTILLADGLVTPMSQALQPQPGKPGWFGLIPVRSPLLGECSLFLWVLRCFSSPGSLHRPYVFRSGCRWIAAAGFPIRKSPDQHLYTASRGLSQCPTSFIGIWRQGIHRAPLVAYTHDTEKSKFSRTCLVRYYTSPILLLKYSPANQIGRAHV